MRRLRLSKKWPARLAIAIGGAMLLVGITLGQPGAVMAKAIRVCLECIGIG